MNVPHGPYTMHIKSMQACVGMRKPSMIIVPEEYAQLQRDKRWVAAQGVRQRSAARRQDLRPMYF